MGKLKFKMGFMRKHHFPVYSSFGFVTRSVHTNLKNKLFGPLSVPNTNSNALYFDYDLVALIGESLFTLSESTRFFSEVFQLSILLYDYLRNTLFN